MTRLCENRRLVVAQRKESIMLVLSRQINEQIHIGNDIHVTVVAIRGDKVRLGIEAPKSVPILRDEILQRIRPASRYARSRTTWTIATTSESLSFLSKTSTKPQHAKPGGTT